VLVDSHCHLDMLRATQASGSVDATLATARAAGVGHFLCVGVHPADQARMLALCGSRTEVSCSAGLHPCGTIEVEPTADDIAGWCDDPRIVAVGETGLDYAYAERVPIALQQQRFRSHLRAARELGLPVIVHTRDARADTLAILREERADLHGGVMHCFTEDLATAEAAVALGFAISFSGIVTFRNADPLRAVARALPLECVLVETDAPYLAPVPMRGRENEPAFVAHVAAQVAAERGEDLAAIAAQTTANFRRAFPRAAARMDL
jgi:TatD DNase family protein